MNNVSKDDSQQIELARVRAGFVQRGESIADWSRQHGFQPNSVYQVLNGYTRGMRGNAHHIAVALGVKAMPEASLEAKDSAQPKERVMS